MSAADLAQFGKLVVAVAKKYFSLPGGHTRQPRFLNLMRPHTILGAA